MGILSLFKKQEEKWVQWKYLKTDESKEFPLNPECRHNFMDERKQSKDEKELQIILTCYHCNGKKTRFYRRIG